MKLSLSVKDKFLYLIRKDFENFLRQLNYIEDFDYSSRFQVWADTDKYNWKEDAFVWSQKRGAVPNFYNVTLDGIDICTFHDQMRPQEVLIEFYKGFKKAYSQPDTSPGKVFIDKSNYISALATLQDQDKKQREKIVEKIKSKKVTTPVEKEAKDIAIHVAQSTSTSTT